MGKWCMGGPNPVSQKDGVASSGRPFACVYHVAANTFDWFGNEMHITCGCPFFEIIPGTNHIGPRIKLSIVLAFVTCKSSSNIRFFFFLSNCLPPPLLHIFDENWTQLVIFLIKAMFFQLSNNVLANPRFAGPSLRSHQDVWCRATYSD
jgi:hypothetical protein